MSRPARRGFLAAVSTIAALGTPALAAAHLPTVGPVEALVRCLPALEAAARATDDALEGVQAGAERDRLWERSMQAARALHACQDAALATAPETVMDALLVIALAAAHARDASEFRMGYGNAAQDLRAAARASRRAADFIAASIGRDLGEMLGSDYDHPAERVA
jgi:hypothetical protein